MFKLGFRGVCQHCGEQDLQRYLNEFAFRHNHRVKFGINDDERALTALRGIDGKRLTYRRIGGAETPRQLARAFLRWSARLNKPPLTGC